MSDAVEKAFGESSSFKKRHKHFYPVFVDSYTLHYHLFKAQVAVESR